MSDIKQDLESNTEDQQVSTPKPIVGVTSTKVKNPGRVAAGRLLAKRNREAKAKLKSGKAKEEVVNSGPQQGSYNSNIFIVATVVVIG